MAGSSRNDLLTILMLTNSGVFVKVLAYKRADKEMTYEPRISFDPQLDSGSKLQSVIPVDLDFNGQTDLLLVVCPASTSELLLLHQTSGI